MSRSRSRKKAKFTENSSETGYKKLLVPLVVLSLVLIGFLSFSGSGEKKAESVTAAMASQEVGGESQQNDKVMKIPLLTFDDGKAHYYEYQSDSGKTIRFFAVKSGDGIVRAAFDACDVCYRAKNGYSQDGDEMICNECGMRFPLDKINEVKGGCNPSPLKREVVGDYLVISKDDIETGARYF